MDIDLVLGMFPAKALRDLWDAWGIDMLILVSFGLHTVLTVFGSRRRYIPGLRIRFAVWSAYLLSSSVQKIIMGKLTAIQVGGTEKPSRINWELKAMFAPLLLVQIGNPDTITAYSIEDNKLGLRQLLTLFLQVCVVAYILSKFWTNSSLSFLYLLMFSAGIIKCGELVWALKSALRNSGLTIADIEQEQTAPALFQKLPKDIPGLELILKAYYRFNCLKPHLSNWLYQPLYESLPWMSIDAYSPDDIFKIIDVELGFMYDVLYTKAPIIFTRTGCVLRVISFLSLVSTLCGFTVFFKDAFVHHIDAGFTYLVLTVVFVLEVYQIALLPFSDWAIIEMIKYHNLPIVTPCLRVLAPHSIKRKRWANSLAQFNLVEFCLHNEHLKSKKKILNIRNVSLKFRKSRNRTRLEFPKELKEMLVQEMKEVDKDRELKPIKQRGQWALERYGCLNQDFQWSVKRDFDKSITIWHIATDLCHNSDAQDHENTENYSQMEMSKQLSNYMMYLLAMRSHMFSLPTAEIIFQHACTKLIAFLRSGPSRIGDEGEACRILRTTEFPKELDSNREKETMVTSKWHVLHDAQRLAGKLMDRENRWQIISSVWVEMLCYAASNCPVEYHAEQLRRGGGLITHVWLLLAHKTDKFYNSD